MTSATDALLTRFREGRRGALARAISWVEDEEAGFQELLHAVLEGMTSSGTRIGVTGPPGAGKSTLVSAMTAAYRERKETVGIVAVDPTSPFSGGALLGDRIRMTDFATDAGVFIRSMASRSALGGLATTTREVVDLVEAFGFDRIVVETVGVGQTDLQITEAADTVAVVVVPESGDAVQAMKAGLMEIADVFVVNKADRPGADRVVRDLKQALELGDPEGRRSRAESDGGDAAAGWEVPVVRTVASSGTGVPELLEALEAHGRWLRDSGELKRRLRGRVRSRIREVVERDLRRRVWKDEAVRALLESGVREVVGGGETPYSVARRIVDRWAGP